MLYSGLGDLLVNRKCNIIYIAGCKIKIILHSFLPLKNV